MKLIKLDDSQVEAFDTEYVDDIRWAATVEAHINRDFPDGHFSFLDVGGGNGNFADRILAQYPNSVGTVLDNSATMLSRNKPNERKTVILDSVENLEKENTTYDMISLNWVLHHVVSDSYTQSRRNQVWTLKTVKALLTARGRVSIFENLYDGYCADSLPGRMIFNLTSSKAISRITRRLGANTAGVGVCFLSKKQWFSTIHDAGMKVLSYSEPDDWTWSLSPYALKLFLHVRSRYVGHFWLGVPEPPSISRKLENGIARNAC